MTKKIKSNNSGITLIALVVTIIVLIILVGIVVSTLMGDNGIIKRAGEAKESQRGATVQDEVTLAIAENEMIDQLNSVNGKKDKKKTKKKVVENLEEKGYLKTDEADKLLGRDQEEQDTIKIGSVTIDFSRLKGAIIPEDIFVALYDDGTLVFSHDATSIDSSKVEENYNNIKNGIYDNWEGTPTPWQNSALDINKVVILNEVIPKNTDFWFEGLWWATEIENIENLNTTNVTSMKYMFCGCFSVSSLDVSNFDTSNVTNMEGMFERCLSVEALDLSGFNISKVTNMSYMFCNNDDDSGEGIKTVYVGQNWNTSSVTESTNMFLYTNLIGGNGTRYVEANPKDKTYARVDTSGTPGYFTAVAP